MDNRVFIYIEFGVRQGNKDIIFYYNSYDINYLCCGDVEKKVSGMEK
ncbi:MULTISPECIES: hypothetical protein [Eubacterium]|uniref:Uncharacterized protein n=1 Tax=Eubacterium segne TaxID=2763045 RepID=A0ABR7F580_9FIRM|nr:MULTISPECIES: hypothetical protein [Eubacterium]MBC5667890.1 hypothetical protein [Eubacterium segne]